MDISVGGREIELSREELFLMLIALLVIGYGGYGYAQQRDAIETAVAVDATITEVGVTQSDGHRIEYSPTVAYEYQYEGTTYTGTDVFPGKASSSYDTRSEARAIIDPYAENETAKAYVNPQSPTDAFLKKQTDSGPLLLAGIGVIAFMVPLIRGRQNAIDGSQTHPQQHLERDTEVEDMTILGFEHDYLGTICKRSIIASFVATWLSLISMVFAVFAAASSTRAPSIQIDLFSSVGIVFLIAFLSGSALIVSLVIYGGWSHLEGRRLRTTRQFERHRGRIGLLFADEENLNRYERRVRLTEVSLLIALFLLTALLEIMGVIDIPG